MMKAEFSFILFIWILTIRGGDALREGPRLLQEPPAVVTFPNSRGASLTCIASATPAPTITWVTADGARADNMGGLRTVISVHGNSTLTLLPFRPDQYRHDLHAATYRCLTSNNVGTVTSRSVTVNAVVMQRFEVGVSDAAGVVGGPAVFTCDVPPTVSRHVSVTSWTVDGRTISPASQPDGRYWILPTGELVIQGVAPTDAYTRVSCTAAHAFDPTPRTSNIARVIVTGEPRLSRPQLLLRRDLIRPWTRDDLILPCLARGHPTPSITWYRDEESRGRVSVGGSGRVQVTGGQLILTSLRQQDSGHYLCIANNSAGTDSYRVDVQVRDRLSVSVDPSLQRIDLGRPARLTCRVSGSPVNSVTWYKDGRPLPPLPRITTYDRTLHIGQVSREDGGMYQCLARNDEDSAQGVAQLDLGDSAPVLDYRFISQTLQPGPSVSLKCIASGAPTPHVSWTLDSFPLPQHERLVVGQYVGVGGSVVSHVNLTGVRAEDGGAYTCIASNRAGSSSHTARLNVYGPAYVRPMSIVTAVAGEQLIISCPAAGYPLAQIIWSRDGRNLPVTARQNVFENGTLVVRHVQKAADSGEYTCTAQDKQGRTHSSTATVQVLVPPKLSSFNFRQDLTLGERVSAQCGVNGGDTPLQIIWTKDGVPAEGVGGIQVRLFDQYISVLVIPHLTPVHAGNYTCTATNDAASVKHTAPLHVNVPPSWLEAPRDSSVILGGSVHIPCHAQGFPTPKINWRRTREDQPGQYSPILSGGLGLGVGVASNGSLVVMGARAEDEGQYLCEASNGVGGGLSALVKLTVNAPPRFSPGLQQTVSVRRGSRASLVCQVLGDPPITLLWQATHANTHDNSMVREVDGGVRGELVIPSVNMEDAGEYTCAASNTYGRDSYVVTLVVQDVPGSPHGLRVSERGSRFLSVSWLSPSTAQTAIDKYIVQYTAAAGSWGEGEEVVVDGATHTTRLSPLLPDTEYLVRLLAANHLGSSPHSEPLQVRTEGEAPSASPTGVRADAVSANSIRVMWEPPPSHTHHGDLLGYNLGIRRQDVGGDGSYNFTVVGVGVGGSKGREMVNGLSAWAQYAVVMRAYNTHGPGPLSSPVVVRTMEDVPSAAPVGVECSGGAGGSSLVVRWAPPPPSSHNGVLQGYRLTLTRLDESTDDVEELRKMTNGREESVGGLRAWTNYTVSVAAVTRAGAGVASHDLTCTTKEDVAGIPRGLRALQSDITSALLTWLAPKPPTGVLLAYTLHHRPPHARAPVEHPLHAHANSHTLTHLSRGTHEFWMTARTRVGEGPPTPTVKLTMLDQVPAGVGSVGGLVVTTQGEDVRLPCVTVGSPRPRPIWTLHGRQLHKNARFNIEDEGSLVIRGIERGDRGNYSCSIHTVRKHPYVHTSATYSLHVQVPPLAPSVHIADTTSSTLTVSWASGDTGGAAVRAWAVWWRAAAGGGSWHTRELGRTYTSHTIGNLKCGAEYQVYVTARTHVGLSPPSHPLIARTSGSPPVAPPTRHVASGNNTGVWVWLGRWMDGGCPITHFTLQMRSPTTTTWTTLASSLAPQEVYEVGGLRAGTNVGLRLTAHNAAGATTTTVNVHTGPGGGLGAQPAGGLEEAPPNHLHADPRLLASAAASALALALTVAAAVLCLRRRAAAGRRSRTSQEDQEAEENKANLLHQRDSYYATVRKPQPVPATLERIPEYSEDIYPYATFQLGEGRGGQDDTATAKFQTFVFQDSRYGVTESHPPSSPTRPTAIKAHGRSRSHGRGVGGPRSESEEYDSLQSDTDTEHATSSRTESSIHLDSATLENHASLHLPLDPHLATLEGGRVDPHLATLEGRADPLSSRRSSNRNVHHNLIYHAPESSTSTEPSPICERKSFPRKTDISKMGRVGAFSNRGLSKMAANIRGVGAGIVGGGGSQETSLSIPKKGNPGSAEAKGSDESKYGFTRRITPPVGFSSSHNELSEAECDLEIRKRNKEVDASGAYVGHSRSQFRSYSSGKDNKDYSIKV